ncbi:MAG: efflux RND transporter periplasmic adaptor subunit [Marinifilaceae bacterium]
MKKIVKRSLQIGLPIAVIAIAVAWPSENKKDDTKIEAPKAARSSLPVTGVVAKYVSSQSGITANGTLMPNEEVVLVSEIAGKVKQIYFEEGKRVRKGDLLLKVDDADLQAQLARSKYQEKLLSEKLDRQRILLQRESISKESFDQLLTDFNMLRADIDLLEVKISRTEIRAPFDGTMGFRQVSTGSYLQPSTQIARIVDNTVLKYEFAIAERYAGIPLLGRNIEFFVTGNEKPFTAQIYAIDPSVDNVRMIKIRARFKNNKFELMPGMFAKGLFTPETEAAYIAIPTEAVVPEVDGKRIWVKRNGKAELVPVETVSRNERFVEVVEGINQGDTVLTGGLMQLRAGMGVKVTIKE